MSRKASDLPESLAALPEPFLQEALVVIFRNPHVCALRTDFIVDVESLSAPCVEKLRKIIRSAKRAAAKRSRDADGDGADGRPQAGAGSMSARKAGSPESAGKAAPATKPEPEHGHGQGRSRGRGRSREPAPPSAAGADGARGGADGRSPKRPRAARGAAGRKGAAEAGAAPDASDEEQGSAAKSVQVLLAMGFDAESAEDALSKTSYVLPAAVELLMHSASRGDGAEAPPPP